MTSTATITHLDVSTMENQPGETTSNTLSTMGIVHSVIASVGIVTNLTVIVVFLNHRKLRRKIPNICIINQVSFYLSRYVVFPLCLKLSSVSHSMFLFLKCVVEFIEFILFSENVHWHVWMKMYMYRYMYNIIYLYICVIGIGDKSLPIYSNKNTDKVTAPVHRKK